MTEIKHVYFTYSNMFPCYPLQDSDLENSLGHKELDMTERLPLLVKIKVMKLWQAS